MALAILSLLGLVLQACFPLHGACAGATEITPLPVQRVAPGVYVHQGEDAEATPENMGAIANIGFVVGKQAVAVIDTGGSFREGQALLAAVRQVTSLPIRYVINTHFHPDHVLGNAAFADQQPVFVAHANLARDLAARTTDYLSSAKAALGGTFDGTRIVLPRHPINRSEQIDLGGRLLELTAYPPAHTDADLTVLDVATGTFFTGDLLFVRRIPSVDGSILGWLQVIDRLTRTKASRAVPGHGPISVPWPQALGDERRYLSLIVSETRQQLHEGHSLSEAVAAVGAAERPKWQLFDDYNERNVTAAYTELEWE